MPSYDAILLLSFGGPEQPADVMPFLENVLRGRNVPPERMRKVAEHYFLFDGRSPINDQCRALLRVLRPELDSAGITLPLYWGNRNWRPYLADTLRQMAADGVRRALVFVTAAYSSYSTCRQYREDLERAAAEVEDAPILDKLPPFFDHPGFLDPNAHALRAALRQLPGAPVLFTAHSIPVAMAQSCDYVRQLEYVAARVAAENNVTNWKLVFQSRSGPPSQPWLEPDILEALRRLRHGRATRVIVAPIGFISDHMEVVYDLDVEAAQVAADLHLDYVRASTAGTHPRFVAMIRELVEQALDAPAGPAPCALTCCPPPARPARPV